MPKIILLANRELYRTVRILQCSKRLAVHLVTVLSILSLPLQTAALTGLLFPQRVAAAPVDTNGYTVDSVVYDMYGDPCRTDGTIKNGRVIGACPWGKHEALPQRLPPNFDFYHGARPGGDNWPLSGKYVSAWGQVFAAEPGNSVWNVRLQVDEHTLWILFADNVWREVNSNASRNVEGTYWNGQFKTQDPSDAEKGIRSEGGHGRGGHSFRLGPMQNKSNYATFHWWWSGYFPRAAVPNDAKGVWQGGKMRLIPDTDPNVNLSGARFIASIGSDRYSAARHVSDGTAIAAMMQPRMKFVTSQWRYFSGTTLTEAQLRANPPPPVSGVSGGVYNPNPDDYSGGDGGSDGGSGNYSGEPDAYNPVPPEGFERPELGVVDLPLDCTEGVLDPESGDCKLASNLIKYVNSASALVGLAVAAMIIWGAIQYAASKGNPQAVTSAKKRLQIAIGALFLYIFIFSFLQWLVPGGVI